MDTPDLLPTALFSPSKAAEQRALAQSWSSIDTWLSTKYQGRSVPQFERNEDTLKALLALSAANEKADEERELLWNVQREALAEMKTKEGGELLGLLEEGLDALGKEALEALAETGVRLDGELGTVGIAEKVVEGTVMEQMLSQQLLQLTQLQKSLEDTVATMRSHLQELRSPAFQAPLSLQRQTLEWTRNTKQLKTKIGEYGDRLAAVQGGEVMNTRALVEREEGITELEDRLALLLAKVDAYKGLPKDRDAAISEVRDVEVQVAKLQGQLDAIFEGLIESV